MKFLNSIKRIIRCIFCKNRCAHRFQLKKRCPKKTVWEIRKL